MLNPFQKIIETQLESVQKQIGQAMDELRRMELEASAGGGAVTVRVTGLGEILDVKIDPEVIAGGDVELIQDLVCAGVREALRKASEMKREKVMAATPLGAMGMELPDIF